MSTFGFPISWIAAFRTRQPGFTIYNLFLWRHELRKKGLHMGVRTDFKMVVRTPNPLVSFHDFIPKLTNKTFVDRWDFEFETSKGPVTKEGIIENGIIALVFFFENEEDMVKARLLL
jgi:hypothetical protein